MKTMFKRKEREDANEQNKSQAAGGTNKLNNLLSREKSVIAEASEAEECNTTQLRLGRLLLSETKSPLNENRAENSSSELQVEKQPTKDRNRESMFGTMLLSNDH